MQDYKTGEPRSIVDSNVITVLKYNGTVIKELCRPRFNNRLLGLGYSACGL